MSPSPFVEALNAHTVREEQKLNAIHDRLMEIVAIQAEQKAILAEHIRRSNANEDSLEVLRQLVITMEKALAMRIRPLEDAALSWATVGKVSAALVTLAGTIVGILKAVGAI